MSSWITFPAGINGWSGHWQCSQTRAQEASHLLWSSFLQPIRLLGGEHKPISRRSGVDQPEREVCRSIMLQSNSTLIRLREQFGQRELVPLVECSHVISKSPAAVYKLVSRGKLPFPVLRFSGSLLVRLADLANWIDNATSPTGSNRYEYVAATGRPTNEMRVEAARLGMSVREYRAERLAAIDPARSANRMMGSGAGPGAPV